jgi:hypothetical protein
LVKRATPIALRAMREQSCNRSVISQASFYTAEDAVKKILMALAVVMLAGLFWSQPAEARCWWNGFRWHCTHYYRHHYWSGYYPYRYYHPYYYGYYRPYYYRPVCTPWPLCWG